jgi:hypothetical protein
MMNFEVLGFKMVKMGMENEDGDENGANVVLNSNFMV